MVYSVTRWGLNEAAFAAIRGRSRCNGLWLTPPFAFRARDQRCDAADRHAPVGALGPLRLHFQLLLAIALRHQVLRRHPELLGERYRHRLGAPVG
jgi:hypothetical protein